MRTHTHTTLTVMSIFTAHKSFLSPSPLSRPLSSSFCDVFEAIREKNDIVEDKVLGGKVLNLSSKPLFSFGGL